MVNISPVLAVRTDSIPGIIYDWVIQPMSPLSGTFVFWSAEYIAATLEKLSVPFLSTVTRLSARASSSPWSRICLTYTESGTICSSITFAA